MNNKAEFLTAEQMAVIKRSCRLRVQRAAEASVPPTIAELERLKLQVAELIQRNRSLNDHMDAALGKIYRLVAENEQLKATIKTLTAGAPK